MIRALLLLALVCVLQAPQPPAPAFRSGVDVVRVDVLVTANRKPVAGLTAADFELRDSGVVQTIESVGASEVPVSMLLALDTSGSVHGRMLTSLKAASNAALDALGAGDRSALLTFSGPVEFQAPWAPPGPAIRTALERVQSGGNTSLYDAAFAALALRDTVPGNRGLVVLFSDGADTSSWLPAHAVLDKAMRSDAVVYTVGNETPERRLEFRSGVLLRPMPPGQTVDSTPFVRQLAQITGGASLPSGGTAGLGGTFASIVNEFRTRYVITYTPRGVDARGWHPIDVRVKRRNVKVTARRGYSR